MRKKSEGVTLIALIITIIVLLILAGVTIAMVIGDNGILNRAANASEENCNATINEALQLEYGEYITLKTTDQISSDLIGYLESNSIISNGTVEGEYVIDVEMLTGSEQSYGNGTQDKEDVYMIIKN